MTMLKSLTGLFLASALFMWGFLSHRHNVFPQPQLRRLAQSVGLIAPDPPEPPDSLRTIISQPREQIDLLALPYLSRRADARPERRGVVVLDPEKAGLGYNFYTSLGQSRAFLIDRLGRPLHQWRFEGANWEIAHLFGNGDVLAMVRHERLVKLDRDSNLLWEYKDEVHHDFWVDRGGRVYVLTREPRLVPSIHTREKVLVDKITVLSAEGVKVEEISVLDAVQESPYRYLLPAIGDLAFEQGAHGEELEVDILHTNHVEILEGRSEDGSAIFGRGNILISIRNINVIAVLDGNTHAIVWIWGPNNLISQHHPTFLSSGNILIFNNRIEHSQIVELNPLTGEVEWRYEDSEFYSRLRGSSQRLSNGNTLITESDDGRVFEVTPAGQLVWEFMNPDVDDEGNRAGIARMVRYQEEQVAFLEEQTERPD